MFVATEPYSGFPAASPPSTITRPSASTVWPAQNRLLPAGCAPIAPLAVFRTFAPAPSSKNRTDDVPGRRTACCITVPPEATGPLHAPVAARGSGGPGGGPGVGGGCEIGTHAAAPRATTSALSQRARRRGRASVL